LSDLLSVVRCQVDFLLPVLITKKVQVFQSCRWTCTFRIHLSSNSRSFEVVDSCDVVFVSEFKSVAHHHQINRKIIFHLHFVNSVNSRKHALRVGFEMFIHLWQDVLD
jgi:hypothetical protein